MEMRIKFPGNKAVAAQFDGFTVLTDQPKESGGDGAAPSPFDLFLASIGTCAGIFALSFCRKRGLSTEGLEIAQTAEWDDKAQRVSRITLKITLPTGFPEKYRDSLVRTAGLCSVKKHIFDPPLFKIIAK